MYFQLESDHHYLIIVLIHQTTYKLSLPMYRYLRYLRCKRYIFLSSKRAYLIGSPGNDPHDYDVFPHLLLKKRKILTLASHCIFIIAILKVVDFFQLAHDSTTGSSHTLGQTARLLPSADQLFTQPTRPNSNFWKWKDSKTRSNHNLVCPLY